MKKIIVIGGAGFIGTNLVISAIKRGCDVVIFDNLSRPGTNLNLDYIKSLNIGNFDFLRGDIRNKSELEVLFEKHGDCDAIFHFAAQVAVTTSVENPSNDFEINAMGAINILETMRIKNISSPIIYTSTNKVYGKMSNVVIKENNSSYSYEDFPKGISEKFPLEFYSPYGCSKGSADQYFLDYSRIFGIKSIVFRQSCIYGYNQFGIEDQGWVAWFTIAAMFEKPITIFGDGKQVRDVLFISDLVDAYWLAIKNIDKTNGQAYNIGGGPEFSMSLLELIEFLEDFFEKQISVDFSKSRPGDQLVYISDIDKARKDFKWNPLINPREGVKKLVNWCQNNRELFIKSGII